MCLDYGGKQQANKQILKKSKSRVGCIFGTSTAPWRNHHTFACLCLLREPTCRFRNAISTFVATKLKATAGGSYLRKRFHSSLLSLKTSVRSNRHRLFQSVLASGNTRHLTGCCGTCVLSRSSRGSFLLFGAGRLLLSVSCTRSPPPAPHRPLWTGTAHSGIPATRAAPQLKIN